MIFLLFRHERSRDNGMSKITTISSQAILLWMKFLETNLIWHYTSHAICPSSVLTSLTPKASIIYENGPLS